MRQARVRSLAKINLALRVLGKRADGYHELRTVFQTVSLADTIDIVFTPGRRTSMAISGNVDIPGNLILKAAEAVLEAMKRTGQVEFKLTKRIPMGGGLGGGSSNAAAVLLALPVLAGGKLPLDARLSIAERLGSDVSFFLLGGAAVGIGRGTELFPLPDPPARPGVIVAPGIHVSTPEAYRALGRGSLTTDVNTSDTYGFRSFAWGFAMPGRESGDSGANDFETVVFRQFPLLQSIQGKLRKLGARPARMSGSGSALFGLFESPEDASRARERLESMLPDVQVFGIRTVTRSSYRRQWRDWLAEHLLDVEESRDSGEWPPPSRYAR
ncbi:MAG: 4-(cytidine 5'-diphospho)-2-C-methyl-D-erythritol kinase [Bryobacteraceae bacterium]